MHRRVAIIAYSLRFPGTDTHRFWNDLLAKKDLVTEVDPSRWSKENFLHPDKRHPGTSYTFAAGSLGDISGFDAAFFGISPREAVLIDPQQRLLLELAWETLENAGILPSSLRGSDCGVYIGISNVDYAYRLADDLAAVKAASATGNISSIAANRISYVFDLHGPSIAMDTACSSSLVAFHQACQAIGNGEISQALTGGINLHLHPYGFISFSKATMLSKTGRCHVFDEAGDGYVRSEGGGLFLLKDYDQAVADGNPILAVVAGSAVNTDGHKSGLTIPNPAAQADLMSRVYRQAGINPDSIDYFEAHGTGTAVGDPIETHAIGLALGQQRQQPLLIGSVKSNLGHLESASGVAGLVKALNCIQHRAVPATISAKQINTHIKLDDWNLRVATDTLDLKPKGELIVGINSFGFGGANAHVILKSHAPKAKNRKKALPAPPKNSLPLIVSGKDSAALKQAAADTAAFLAQAAPASFYDIAYSAFFHRDRHQHAAIVFSDNAQYAAEQLSLLSQQEQSAPSSKAHIGVALTQAKGPVFVYSGNGCQWQGMGRQLLAESEIFRNTLVEIDALFSQYADFSLLDELSGYPADNRYDYTEIAQPALFAVQVGVTELLKAHGVTPTATLGHSVGEVAAAWAAGALSLPQAVEVIYFRSHHQGKTKGLGGMTAVGLGAAEASALLAAHGLDRLSLAGINSHRGTTIAGDAEQLTRLEAKLAAGNVFCKRLPLDYAFHSPEMDGIESGICEDLAELKPSKPTVPFFSTVTGEQITDAALTADYWWHNIRQPVRLQQAVEKLLEQQFNVFVEIGSHPVLHSYLNDGLKASEQDGITVNTLTKTNPGQDQLQHSLAKIIMSGVHFDLKRWFPVVGHFVNLPNYPWQREKLWHPVTSESQGLLSRKKVHPLLGYPLPQHDLTWENQLDTQLQPFLADHNVGGAIVFPGAGFAELALAAAHQYHATDFIEIEELEIRAPLVLGHDQTKLIRFSRDAADGRFNLRSREYGNSSEWQLHCLGRVLDNATGNKLKLTAPEPPARVPDFNAADHIALTRGVDLDYGPAFQALSHGWVEPDYALGVLAIPDGIRHDLGDYYLHPSLLDCTFQLAFQLLKEHLHQHEDTAFVPVKIGRLNLRCGKTPPVMATARLLHKLPHSLKAEFTLYGADGHAIALLQDVRFRAVRLHRQQNRGLSYLDYHLTPAPLRPQAPLTLNAALFAGVGDQIEEAVMRYSMEVEPLLDSLYLQNVTDFLATLTDNNGLVKTEELDKLSSRQTLAGSSLSAMLAYAADCQTLSQTDSLDWQLAQEALQDTVSKTAICNTLIQEYPDYSLLAQLCGRVSLHWDDLLNGRIPPSDLGITAALYGKISSHILEQTGKKVLIDALLEQHRLSLQNLPHGGRLRILEIGNYKPEFAPLLCPAMDFRQADYMFASFCEQALDVAISLREHFPALQTLRLPAASEPPPVIDKATLAIIHLNQGNIDETRRLLSLLPDLLEPNSPVLVVGLNPARWIDGVLGLSEHWWLDGNARIAVSPQLSANAVAEQLASQLFEPIQTHEWALGQQSGHYLITAASPAAVKNADVDKLESGSWLILADNEPARELAARLALHLQQNGQQVTQATTLPELSAYQQIIHLSGFGQDQASAQTQRCWLAGQIIQNLEKIPSHNARLWLITQGVGALWPCDQVAPAVSHHSGKQIAHDAALWGFGRALMNEASNFQVRLLDINGDCQDHRLLAAIGTELLTGNRQEIVLTQYGQRFAPRLRNEPAPARPLPTPIESSAYNWRLGFKLPGQLRNLQWQAVAPSAPADDDIEVAVQATGLNFRDVMYTLGLLSDEAVENGFVGASLGLEFAGTVTRVGAKVSAFKPGDCVVGLGPASFSNCVLTKASTITLIPEGISPAAAATIPSTFFTVYYALHHQARVQPGEKILIHGAAGGVGIAAIQVARWLGAEIYATVGSEEKRDFLKLLGIEHIHDSRSLSFAEEILAETDNQGVDVVLNSLAGEAINRNFQVLKPFGRFLELGKRDFYENTAIGLRPFRNNISYFGIDADQLMQERPGLTQKLFAEMMQLFHAGVLHPLPYTVFDANQVADAFRFMQQAKQIGKVVVTYQHGVHAQVLTAAPEKQAPLLLSDQASYLVTGGLSGFGLRTAQWLVEKGAKHLILLGRSGPSSDEAKAALAEWSKQGVSAHAAACDVADKAALSLLLEQCAIDMPPLKGIVHAAAVIDDGLIRNLTEKQLHDVLLPKIQGALALHELTLAQSLDFFVLYSSVTTLFGNPGQANYVAGNLWLEALAAYRCQQGLPATCIRWGAIDDAGFLARNPKIKEALKNRMGGHAMSSSVALDVLATILATGKQTLGVMEFDWRTLSNFLPSSRSDKFAELAVYSAGNDHGDDHPADIKRLLEELSDDELQTTFVDMLKEELSQILLVNKDKINPDHSMYDMGLDSLMGVELMVAIETRFNVQIPVMALSEAPTLNKLANRLIAQLRGDTDGTNNDMEANIHDLSKRHGSAMSDEQLSALVQELGANKNAKILSH